jgi:hypothetical protein
MRLRVWCMERWALSVRRAAVLFCMTMWLWWKQGSPRARNPHHTRVQEEFLSRASNCTGAAGSQIVRDERVQVEAMSVSGMALLNGMARAALAQQHSQISQQCSIAWAGTQPRHQQATPGSSICAVQASYESTNGNESGRHRIASDLVTLPTNAAPNPVFAGFTVL